MQRVWSIGTHMEPIHNQGLLIAIGAFCINKTENVLCEAGMSDLNHRKMIKAAITAVRISSRPEHPMRTTQTDTEEYDNYAVRPKLIKPYPIRALVTCASLNIDLQKQILTSLRCLPKGAG
jgi:hypothetical protein